VDGKWTLTKNPDKRALYDKFRNDFKLSAIVSLREKKSFLTPHRCSRSNASHPSKGHGLFTRHVFTTNYCAVSPFGFAVLILDPPASAGSIEKFLSFISANSVVPLKDFPEPKDPDNLTEAEMLPVKARIMRYIDDYSALVGETLRAKK
jgi:hypothetical protein